MSNNDKRDLKPGIINNESVKLNGRTLEQIIKEDKELARVIEINLKFLDIIKTVQHIDADHLKIREGKILLDYKVSILKITDK